MGRGDESDAVNYTSNLHSSMGEEITVVRWIRSVDTDLAFGASFRIERIFGDWSGGAAKHAIFFEQSMPNYILR